MQEFDKAEDVLATGERGLFIFTRGAHVKLNDDGTASSGYWKVAADPSVDRVVLYVRDENRPAGSQLYAGELVGTKGGRSDGRRTVFLEQVRHIGSTRSGWWDFASTNANPIRYISR